MIQADRSTAATYKKKYVNVCERESERARKSAAQIQTGKCDDVHANFRSTIATGQ